jgi:protein-tyrosine phosphatase
VTPQPSSGTEAVPVDGFAVDPTALDRSIRFDVVFNVRDLGGLPTSDGRRVRQGLVFRADGVQRLAGDDLERARSLGLRTVIDLRTAGEIERGGRFPVEHHPVDWHHLPVLQRMWSDDDLVATSGAADFLRDRYLDMLTEGGRSIAQAIELVSEGGPALFHCAAGKDRTGVVAAVLLGLLGVPEDEIAGDYHATAGAMAAFVDWLTLEFPEAVDSMTSQPPEYLEAPMEAMAGFLEVVNDRHGSMEGLAQHLGVAEPAIDRLRTSLLD